MDHLEKRLDSPFNPSRLRYRDGNPEDERDPHDPQEYSIETDVRPDERIHLHSNHYVCKVKWTALGRVIEIEDVCDGQRRRNQG